MRARQGNSRVRPFFIGKMTTDAILQSAHRIYVGDVEYPTSGDDDYSLRLGLVGDGINSWALKGSEENVQWKELFTNLTDAADGDKTAAANDYAYDCPTDFVELSSWVKIGDLYWEVINPNQVMQYTKNDPGGRWCYITGNSNTGFVLNVNQPIAGTITYDYYKTPTIPTVGSDVVEMRRPYFLVHYILARLYELDSRNDLVTLHEGKMANILNAMVIDNDLDPFNNSYKLGDLQSDLDGVRWGQ